MKKQIIIDGYKGIIPLDLTLIDPALHKSLIDHHFNDIKEYQKEQSKLKPELRYENTIGKIKIMHDKEKQILKEKLRLEKKEQDRLDSERLRIFYDLQEKNKDKISL